MNIEFVLGVCAGLRFVFMWVLFFLHIIDVTLFPFVFRVMGKASFKNCTRMENIERVVVSDMSYGTCYNSLRLNYKQISYSVCNELAPALSSFISLIQNQTVKPGWQNLPLLRKCKRKQSPALTWGINSLMLKINWILYSDIQCLKENAGRF